MARRPKGTPLDAPERSRPVSWKLRASERQRLQHELEDEHGALADYFRQRIAAAVDATGRAPGSKSDELVSTSLRMDAPMMAAVSHAAALAGLDAKTWLSLVTTESGDVLLRQLMAARARRTER